MTELIREYWDWFLFDTLVWIMSFSCLPKRLPSSNMSVRMLSKTSYFGSKAFSLVHHLLRRRT